MGKRVLNAGSANCRNTRSMRWPWRLRWVWEFWRWAAWCSVRAGLNLVGLSVLLAVATELGLLAGFRLVRDLARHVRRGPKKARRRSSTG